MQFQEVLLCLAVYEPEDGAVLLDVHLSRAWLDVFPRE
jgi:hypothetical protein